MRIVFVGCVLFSRAALQFLLDMKADVVGVVTKENSTFNADFCNLTDIAIQAGIPCKQVNDINHPNNILWIKDLSPDIIFCFGWSSLLKKELLSSTPMGVIGYHPASLPNNKGRHPLIWTKVLGLPNGGSTFFFMDEGADSGDILHQQLFPVSFDDDASVIYRKMTETALHQISVFVPMLQDRSYKRSPQDPRAGNAWRKRGVADGAIDFRMSTISICNLVRALAKPYVGAHCVVDGNLCKVWKVDVGNCMDQNIEPGKILSISDKRIEIKTGDSSIFLIDHELPVSSQLNKYIF